MKLTRGTFRGNRPSSGARLMWQIACGNSLLEHHFYSQSQDFSRTAGLHLDRTPPPLVPILPNLRIAITFCFFWFCFFVFVLPSFSLFPPECARRWPLIEKPTTLKFYSSQLLLPRTLIAHATSSTPSPSNGLSGRNGGIDQSLLPVPYLLTVHVADEFSISAMPARCYSTPQPSFSPHCTGH